MKNRAKCKLCGEILESFHRYDYVSCKCGEIAIDGGQDYFRCSAKDWRNFVRVDDFDNEIPVKIEGEPEVEENRPSETPQKLTKRERLDILDQMIKNFENLPSNAMLLPINHYDFCSFMLLVRSILSED